MPARGPTGTWIPTVGGGEQVNAFLPKPLPPEPALTFTSADHDLLERANRALGRLDGLARLLPDPDLFIYLYVRKEAVLSSQIEGTQSSLSDLLLFESEEAPGVPIEDVQEVSNYVAAMTHGLERLRSGFPLSLRLFRDIHGVLLSKGRGASKRPGEFRTTQNWIGSRRASRAVYVPPPPQEVIGCLGALEKFLHDQPERTPTLIKAALAHVQFETIHPFLDGNGRLGRLLVTFLLCAEGAISQPILYLSLYFKQNRSTYYELLQRVRTEGVWEDWLQFFMEGVIATADEAVATAQKIRELFERDRQAIQKIGRQASSALRVHDHMQRKPLFTITDAAKHLELSTPTVAACVDRLQKLKLVRELTKKQRYRLFAYASYLDLLTAES